MVFYEKLMYLLNERGISKKKLIDDLNLNGSAIQNWRRQGSKPRPETMAMIADYFNVDRNSLSSDNLPIMPASKNFYETFDAATPSYIQRVLSLKRGYEITDDMISKFSRFLNAKITFLMNMSEKEYDPDTHGLPEKPDVDFSTVFDVFELLDRYPDNELMRTVGIQISKIILYRVSKRKDENGEDFKLRYIIDQDKLKFLTVNQPTANVSMNYGLNYSDLVEIHRKTGLGYFYLLSGIEKGDFEVFIK